MSTRQEDYLALEANKGNTDHGLGNKTIDNLEMFSGITSDVVREVLIPEIEREVNEGKIFSNLRQIYNSMILATWFKDNFRESLLGQIYVDRSKTQGVDTEDKEINNKIYNQYVEAFKKGVYNFVREDYDPATQAIISRKFFSGGASLQNVSKKRREVNRNPVTGSEQVVGVELGGAQNDFLKVDSGMVAGEVVGKNLMGAISSSKDELPAVNVRLVDTGSTGRGTNIEGADFDFVMLFQKETDVEMFWKNKHKFFDSLSMYLKKLDFSIVKLKYGKKNNLGTLITYQLRDKNQNIVNLQITTGIDKKIYADYFQNQMEQIKALGGDPEQIRQDILSLKKLFKNVIHAYKQQHGGLNGLGVEQLIIQSSGSEDYGRKLLGVGSFSKAMQWIYSIGFDSVSGRLRDFDELKSRYAFYDPELEENFLRRLNPMSWVRLANAAKKFVNSGNVNIVDERLDQLNYTLQDALDIREEANYVVEVIDPRGYSAFASWYKANIKFDLELEGLASEIAGHSIEIVDKLGENYKYYLFFKTSTPEKVKGLLNKYRLQIKEEKVGLQNYRLIYTLHNNTIVKEDEIKSIKIDVNNPDEIIVQRLIRNLLLSNRSLRNKATELLKPLMQSDVNQSMLYRLAKELDDKGRFSWHTYAIENLLRLSTQAYTKERVIEPERFKYFNDGSQTFPLYAVRIMQVAPQKDKDGNMYLYDNHSELSDESSFRDTVHFSLNGYVQGSPWSGYEYVLVGPFEELVALNKENLVIGAAGDTVFYRPVKIPSSFKLLKTDENGKKEDKVRDYLKNEAKTKQFEIFGTWTWVTDDPDMDKKISKWFVDRNVPFGTHGAHWTLRFELIDRHLDEAFNMLVSRKSQILEWLEKGGKDHLDEIEAYDTELPWWRFNDVFGSDTWFVRFIRLLFREFAEHPHSSKDELFEYTIEALKEFVPERELDQFEKIKHETITRRSKRDLKDYIGSYYNVRRSLAELGLRYSTERAPTFEEVQAAYEKKRIDSDTQEKIDIINGAFKAVNGFMLMLKRVNDETLLSYDAAWQYMMQQTGRADMDSGAFAGSVMDLPQNYTKDLKKLIEQSISEYPNDIIERSRELLRLLREPVNFNEHYAKFAYNLDLIVPSQWHTTQFFNLSKEIQTKTLIRHRVTDWISYSGNRLEMLNNQELFLFFKLLELDENLLKDNISHQEIMDEIVSEISILKSSNDLTIQSALEFVKIVMPEASLDKTSISNLAVQLKNEGYEEASKALNDLIRDDKGEGADGDGGSTFDPAMIANRDTKGGIDLNPTIMSLKTRGKTTGLNWQFDPQQIQNINIDGLYPVIINISPIINYPKLMGIVKEEEFEESLHSFPS